MTRYYKDALVTLATAGLLFLSWQGFVLYKQHAALWAWAGQANTILVELQAKQAPKETKK